MPEQRGSGNARGLRLIASGLLLVALFAALFLARFIVLTALIGVGLGVLLSPLVGAITRRLRVPRWVSGIALVVVILILFSGVTLTLSLLVSDQIEKLLAQAPDIYRKLESHVTSWTSEYPWLKRFTQTPGRIVESFGRWALGGLQAGAAVIAGVVITVALSIFTAINSKRYFNGLLTAFPARARPEASSVLTASGRSLRAWARAQLLDMTCVGAATAIGLWAIGVDYWIVLGLLAGLLDIIPYVGPVTAAVVTLLLTLGSEPEKALWVLGLFLVIQQLEGNVLIPLIMREEAELPEVHLLILIMLMSGWFGLLGALIAAPMLAVGRTVYLMAYKPRMDRAVESADGEQRGRSAA